MADVTITITTDQAEALCAILHSGVSLSIIQELDLQPLTSALVKEVGSCRLDDIRSVLVVYKKATYTVRTTKRDIIIDARP